MSIIISNINLKKAQREQLQADIELYLKQGGKVHHIPSGLCALADREHHYNNGGKPPLKSKGKI